MVPKIQQCMDCSIGHVTGNDHELLIADGEATRNYRTPVLTVFRYNEGFFVTVPNVLGNDVKAALTAAGYSRQLAGLLRIACENRCELLRLDSDGPLYSELPTYTW